jgi:hypothetical protein
MTGEDKFTTPFLVLMGKILTPIFIIKELICDAIKTYKKIYYQDDVSLFLKGMHPTLDATHPEFEPTEACYKKHIIDFPHEQMQKKR